MDGRRARRRGLAGAGSRPGPDPLGRPRCDRPAAGRGRPDGGRTLAGRRDRRGRHPGPVRPADRRDTLPRQHPRGVGRLRGGRPDRGRARRAGFADQRRAGVRAGGAPTRGRARGRVDGRADPRDRRRRRHRGRRQGPPGPRRDRGRGRPPDDRSGRAVVQLRQSRVSRGVLSRRPDRRGVRYGDRGGSRRAGTER